jgi:DNA-binding winged helix-turn-helix (wHTH) protein
MSGILTIAVGRDVLVDTELVQPIVRFLSGLSTEGNIGVLIPLNELDARGETQRARFTRRLARKGLTLHPASLSELPAIARARQPKLYLVQPDLAVPCLTDADAIRIAARLQSHAVILTKDAAIKTAESPVLSNGDIVEHLSFAEMLEIAHSPNSPVSPEAAEQAWLCNTPFKIFAIDRYRWTTVTHDTYEKRVRSVASVTASGDLTFIVAKRDEEQFDARATQRVGLATLARQGVRIEQVLLNGGSISFACDSDKVQTAVTHLGRCSFEVETEACVRLCAIGSALRSASGVMHTMLESLEAASIRPLHVSDSAVTISIMVRERDAQRAEYALRTSFLNTQRLATPVAGQFAFDATTRVLRVRDRSEKLGERQAKLLHLLMQNVGKPIAIESAAQALFGSSDQASIAAVRVHVHNIRKKIEDDPVEPKYILTVPNRGYTFARQWGASLEHDESADPQSVGNSQAS